MLSPFDTYTFTFVFNKLFEKVVETSLGVVAYGMGDHFVYEWGGGGKVKGQAGARLGCVL